MLGLAFSCGFAASFDTLRPLHALVDAVLLVDRQRLTIDGGRLNLPLGGFSPISIYVTCFVLVCLAVALYRVIGRRSERATAVARGPLGVGLGLAARPMRVSESIGAAISSRATAAPRFDGVAVGASREAGASQVAGKSRSVAKSYYASSEGQVQTAMLPPLGIPSDTHDLSAVVPANEWDSTNLGWNNLRLLLPAANEEIVRVESCVHVDTGAQQNGGEGAQTAIVSLVEEVAVGSDASASEENIQVLELGPSPVVDGSGFGSGAFSIEETIEISEIAPAASKETAVEVSAEAVPSEIAEMETAPAATEPGDALSACALPIEQTAENAEIAAPSVADAASDMSTAAEPAAVECVEIAAPLVADESGEKFDLAELAAIAEMEDCSDLPSIAAVVGPPSPAFGFLNFYGLSEQPFDVTPDPAYLYFSPMHREALNSLSKGIENLRGFMALVAEPGMGKTTLLNRLMEDLRDTARTVLLFQTQCNSRELLRYLLSELGIESEAMDAVSMHRALNEILFQEMLNGRRFVLIIDEAQNLDATTLETIRLLSDFETSHAKLIQIVLAGQPQLVETLLRPELSQLRQRIAILTNLEPLCASETAQYIEHRLRAAGASGRTIFTPEALALLAERSHGIPRSINNLCFNALQLGYSRECETIDAEIVRSVAGELDLEALLPLRAQEAASAPEAVAAPPTPSSELARILFDALSGAQLAAQQSSNGSAAKTAIELTGKLSEKLKTRSWGKECEYRIQVSLEREASPEIPVADRYYCCSIYVGEEQAKKLQAGQPVRIRIEQD